MERKNQIRVPDRLLSFDSHRQSTKWSLYHLFSY